MDFKLILPIIILELILKVVALIDLMKRDKLDIRGENKLIWAVIILFISTVGPILYLTIGKKNRY